MKNITGHSQKRGSKNGGVVEKRQHEGQGIDIWTDGSCYPNPGPGGWGVVVMINGRDAANYRAKSFGRQTTAWSCRPRLRGCDTWSKITPPARLRCFQILRTWSTGATLWRKNWKVRGWRRKTPDGLVELLNCDLWKELDALIGITGAKFRWVRGHSGVELNERADALALQARQEVTSPDRHLHV